MKDLPLLGISACLTGENLRYNGSHKLNRPLVEYLTDRATTLSVCAEVECGMPVPREPMDLFERAGETKLLTVNTRRDLTNLITQWSLEKAGEFAKQGMAGFIFKSGSPSCGLGTARLHRNNVIGNSGTGLFAGVMKRKFPGMPLTEADELTSEFLIDCFLHRVMEYKGGARC